MQLSSGPTVAPALKSDGACALYARSELWSRYSTQKSTTDTGPHARDFIMWTTTASALGLERMEEKDGMDASLSYWNLLGWKGPIAEENTCKLTDEPIASWDVQTDTLGCNMGSRK